MRAFLFTLVLAAHAAVVQASVVIPNGPWQIVQTPVIVTGEVITSPVNNNLGNVAYWNNNTNDGTNCANIGCFVTGAGSFTGNPNSPNLSNPVYLGNNNGSAINDFYWSGVTGGSTTMLAEVAGLAGRNWMGWYQQGAILTTANRGTAWDVVFTGGDTVGATAVFTPTLNFGLWFLADFASDPSGVTDNDIITALTNSGRFTESSRNAASAGTSNQYYTAFARSAASAQILPTEFWIGIEDVFLPNADKDYNDMVLRLTVVPEPGYYVLLSIGLLGIWLFHRRYIRKSDALES
jgi:hypothetical protein